jgi:hypothetical protein
MSNASQETRRVKVPRATHHSVVKRLWCIECCTMMDAHRTARSTEYELSPCGHKRILMSSEAVQERGADRGND